MESLSTHADETRQDTLRRKTDVVSLAKDLQARAGYTTEQVTARTRAAQCGGDAATRPAGAEQGGRHASTRKREGGCRNFSRHLIGDLS